MGHGLRSIVTGLSWSTTTDHRLWTDDYGLSTFGVDRAHAKPSGVLRIGARYSGEQSARIRMLGVLVDRFRFADFHNLAFEHHRDAC